MRSRRLLLLPVLLPLAFCEGGPDKLSTAKVNGAGFQAGSDEAFLLTRAERGDAEAQYDLGSRFFYGQGTPKNETKAVHWFKKAAESGHGPAQNFVALMYGQGQGVTVDFAQAAAWALKAAEQGEARGQGLAAMMIFDGRGVPQDAIEGYKWATLAAARAREDDMKAYAARSLQIMGSKMTEAQIAEAEDRARNWTAAWLVVGDDVREKAVRTFCAKGSGPWFIRVDNGLPSAALLARFEADPRFRSVAEANKGAKNPFGQPTAGSVVDVGAIEWRGTGKALIRLGIYRGPLDAYAETLQVERDAAGAWSVSVIPGSRMIS